MFFCPRNLSCLLPLSRALRSSVILCHLKTVEKYVGAFGALQAGNSLVLGRDSRVSGPWVHQLALGTLLAMGYKVYDLGIVSTPTVRRSYSIFTLRKKKLRILKYYDGPVGTSDGDRAESGRRRHYHEQPQSCRMEWCSLSLFLCVLVPCSLAKLVHSHPSLGLKFVDRDGLFLSPEGCRRMFDIADRHAFSYAPYTSDICALTAPSLIGSAGTIEWAAWRW